HPQRLAVEILRQVVDRSADFPVHGMPPAIRRAAQRDDEDVEAAALERGDLLRDERLGEARIALKYERGAQGAQPRTRAARALRRPVRSTARRGARRWAGPRAAQAPPPPTGGAGAAARAARRP